MACLTSSNIISADFISDAPRKLPSTTTTMMSSTTKAEGKKGSRRCRGFTRRQG
ncbi:hypothetical protein CCACVL1_18216 [Corchorus capsularis]|uniref:Uncharacterized protein n=1 Tax=Corchorus capsularis TaxID=210143 RepID=A0A1R3HMA0_COCAP|nr:hypothetical protein CCACVL1_18216 [Corchorus capsularis]